MWLDNCMTRTDISHRSIPTVRQANGNPLLVTIARAAKSATSTGEARYVFCKSDGYAIATEAPTSQRYYEFDGRGGSWVVEA